jgi:hypothetical protein
MGRENVSPDPYTLPQQPELDDLLRVLGRAIKLQVRTHVPAMVVGYVPPPINKATVMVQTLQVVRVTDPTRLPANVVSVSPDAPPNTLATLAPIQLVNIPVALAVGTQGGVTYPITAGDYGMLHVSDRSLAAWLLAGAPCDPVLAATHALGDSVFYPGLRPDTSPIPPTAADPAATVVYGAAQVKLGDNTAVESVTKAESLLLALVTAVTAAPVGSIDGGATFKAGLIAQLSAILPAQVGSVKVKVSA